MPTRQQIQDAIGRAQADGNSAAVAELTAALGQFDAAPAPVAAPATAAPAPAPVAPTRMQLVEAYGRAQADGNDAAMQELMAAIKKQEADGPAPDQPEPIADRMAKVFPALKTIAGGITPWADEIMAGATSLTSGKSYDEELARHRADMESLPERDRKALQYTGMGLGMVGGMSGMGALAKAAPAAFKFGAIPLGVATGAAQEYGRGETPEERAANAMVGGGVGGVTAGIASAAVPVLSGIGRRVAGALVSKNPFNAAGGRGAEKVFREAAAANPSMRINPAAPAVADPDLSEVSKAVLARGGPNAAKIIEYGKTMRKDAAEMASRAADMASVPGARVVGEAGRANRAADAYYAAGLPQTGKPPVTSPVYPTVTKPEVVATKKILERVLEPGRKIPSIVTKTVQTKIPAVTNDLGDALKQPIVKRVVRDLPESIKALPDGDMRKLHEVAKGVRYRADGATDPVQKAAAEEERQSLLKAIGKRNPAYAAAVKEYGSDTKLMDAFAKGYAFDKASAPTGYRVEKMKPDVKGSYIEGVKARIRDAVATSSSPGAAAKAIGVRKSVDLAEALSGNPDALQSAIARLNRAEEVDKLGKILAPESVMAAKSEASLPALVPNVASSNAVGGALRGAGQAAAHAGQVLKFGKKTNRVVGKVLTDPKAAPYLAALLEGKHYPMLPRAAGIGAGMQLYDIVRQLSERN